MSTSRRILVALWVSAAAVAVLLATGTLPSPFASSRPDAAPAPEAPGELDAEGKPRGAGLEAAGMRPDGAGPAMASGADGEAAGDGEPAIPSEASGTAPKGGGAVVRGRVIVEATKSPVEGATVRLVRPDSLFSYVRAKKEGRQDDLLARTDGEGRFTFRNVLPSTGYALYARRGTAAGVTRTKIDLGARETFDAGDLVLGTAGGLGGHVTGPDGKPLPGVRVAVTWQVKNEFSVVLTDAKTLPWVEGTAVTDDAGVWAVPGLEAGDKTVVFEAPSGAADVKTPITVTAGTQRTDVDLAMTGTLEIAGTVVWSDGTPIAGARVFVKPTSGPAGRTHDTPADGTFRIGGLPKGTYVGGCLLAGMPVKMIQGVEAGRTDLKFEFPSAGSLLGRVVSKAGGAPLAALPGDAALRRLAGLDGAVRREHAVEGARPDGVLLAGRHVPLRSPPARAVRARRGGRRLPRRRGGGQGGRGGARDGRRHGGDARGQRPGGHGRRSRGEAARGGPAASRVGRHRVRRGTRGHRPDVRGRGRSRPQRRRRHVPLPTADAGHLHAVREREGPRHARPCSGVNLRARSVEDLKVELRPGATMSVRVNDARGRPVPDAGVVLVHVSGDRTYVSTDGEGVARVERARPGRWVAAYNGAAAQKVRLPEKPEDRGRTADLYRALDGSAEATVLEAGAADLEVRAPRLVRIRGRLILGSRTPTERGIGLYQEGLGVAAWAQFDADGRFTMERVEPGTYIVLLPSEDPDRVGSYGGGGNVTIPDVDEHDLEVPWPTSR